MALVREQADVLLELLVNTLRLAIGLQVVGRRSCDLDSEDAIQFAREVCNELRSAIRYDGTGESVELPDVVQEESRCTLG